MIGGLALGLAGGIIGGIGRARAERKRRKMIKNQLKENENWYQRRYNEDSTQRSDAQNSLRIMRDAIKERTKQVAASGAVTGATDESVALQKESANRALGSTVANIAATGDARKDAIEQQYMENKANLNAQLGNAYAQQGENIASATQGVIGAANPLIEAFSKK